MKKIVFLFMLCVLSFAVLTSCKDENTQMPEVHSEAQFDDSTIVTVGKSIDFGVQYIRTNGYHDGEKYPKTLWITNTDELNDYYELNKDKYFLESVQEPASDQTIGFSDAVKKYDDEFFEEHDLIFVLLEEGSGSIRHEVTDVELLPSMYNKLQYFIQPEIKRLVPDVGTADMAEWHIIIEISKEYGRFMSDLQEPVIH